MSAEDRAPEGIARVRAPNPSPLTLDGTNSYVTRGWVVDPGPADESHLRAVLEAVDGPIEGIVLTHGHPDHAEGAPRLAELAQAPVHSPAGGERIGPFEAIATPGHSSDSVCLVSDRVCFTGDTVLGVGSVFIAPGEGSLAAYLDSLRTLLTLELDAICPGHGPFVDDAHRRIEEQLEHRLERERRLLGALDAGARTSDELLDAAWSEVPQELRFAARVTLEAHLEKLRDEGRLPSGVDLGG